MAKRGPGPPTNTETLLMWQACDNAERSQGLGSQQSRGHGDWFECRGSGLGLARVVGFTGVGLLGCSCSVTSWHSGASVHCPHASGGGSPHAQGLKNAQVYL